jgi:hypothetical protein
MRSVALLFLATFLATAGCNSILGIPDVELQTCTNPIAPEAGYGIINANTTGLATESPTLLFLRANLNSATRPDILRLELYDGSSWVGNNPVPGTYDLVGNETIYDNPSGCGICVRIWTQVDANFLSPSAQYMPRSGTLRLTNTTGRLVGSLENLELRRVNIGPSPDFTTTDHTSGCGTSITRVDFDLPLVPAADAGGLDAI